MCACVCVRARVLHFGSCCLLTAPHPASHFRFILQVSHWRPHAARSTSLACAEGHRAGEMLPRYFMRTNWQGSGTQKPVRHHTKAASDWIKRFWWTLCTVTGQLSGKGVTPPGSPLHLDIWSQLRLR